MPTDQPTKPDYSGSAEALNASFVWHARHRLRRVTGRWRMRRARFNINALAPPVIVGATGGSGTRAIAQVLQAAGINVGSRHNFALDAMDFVPFFVCWGRAYITAGADSPEMDFDFELCTFNFRRGIQRTEPWGIKAPRFIYFLPYLSSRLPGFKFVHVVRDGRDMALAPNQSQLRDYGPYLLNQDLSSAPAPVRSIALWNRVNLEAVRFGRTQLGDRYHLLRFEDLCENPEIEITRLLKFAGSSASPAEAASIVTKQETAGRWKSAPHDLVANMVNTAREGLHEFGYL